MLLTEVVVKTLERHYVTALESSNTVEILCYLDQLLAECSRFALGQAISDLYKKFKEDVSQHKTQVNRSLIEYSIKNNIRKRTLKDLEEALSNKDIREIRELILESTELLKTLSLKNKFLLLDSAIGQGKKRVFSQLLAFFVRHEKREDLISIIDYTDNTYHPLLISICLSYNDIQMVESLVDVGANINLRSQKLDNVMVKIAGAIQEVRSPSGWVALHTACLSKNFKMVQFLVNNGAEVNITTSEQANSLHMACLENQPDIVELLLGKGASNDIFKENVLDDTPLFIAFATAIKKRDDRLLTIVFDRCSLETKKNKKKEIERCIKCFSKEIDKHATNGDIFFIALKDKISSFQQNERVSSQSTVSDIRLLAEPATAREIEGDSELYTRVHEDSSTELTNNLSAEVGLCKKSIEQIAKEKDKDEISVSIPNEPEQGKKSNKNRRKKKIKTTENAAQEITTVSEEGKEAQQSRSISTEEVETLQDISRPVVAETSMVSEQEAPVFLADTGILTEEVSVKEIAIVPEKSQEEHQSEYVPSEKEELQTEASSQLLENKEKARVSSSNNDQKKFAKNPKKLEKLLSQLLLLTEGVEKAQTIEELDNTVFLSLNRYENKNRNNPDAKLSLELGRIRELAVAKMVQLMLNDITQSVEHNVLTSALKQEISSVLGTIVQTIEHKESQESQEKEELMSLGSTSSEAVSSNVDEEGKLKSADENIMDFYEPTLQPACLSNPFWQEAFSLLVEIVTLLHYKIFLFGSANYKYNPNDFDLAVYGLSEEEWETWEKIVRDSKNNPSLLETIPLLKYIKDKGGVIECAYKKNEYNGLILKTSFMIQGRKVSWDFSVLPPKMTMSEHAAKLDISIGAMYFYILEKQMFCPIRGTKDHLKQGLLWAIQNPYHMFKADPSVILRLMRIIASTREYKHARLTNKVWNAVTEVLKENPYLLNMKVGERTDYGAADKCYHEMELLFKPGQALNTLEVLHDYSLVCSFFTHLIGVNKNVYTQTLSLMQEVAKLFDSATGSIYYEATKSELFCQRVYNRQGQCIQRALYPSLMYYASCWFLEPHMNRRSSFININREIINYKCSEYERDHVNKIILQALSDKLFCTPQYTWQRYPSSSSIGSYAGSFYQPASSSCVQKTKQNFHPAPVEGKKLILK